MASLRSAAIPTPEDIKRYEELGYWVSPVLFTAEEIGELRAAFERAYGGDLDNGKSWPYVQPLGTDSDLQIKTALFAWSVNEVIFRYDADKRLVDIAAALMRVSRVRLWQDQAIWKPGADGQAVDSGNIGFHQDFSYWQDSSTTNMVSANIALQDVTVANGALRVFPRSHRQGLLSGLGDFFNTDLADLRERFQAEHGLDEEIALELKAGQVSFHHSLLVHGSGPNTTNQPRLVLAPAYVPDGTYYREEGQEPCPHSEFLGLERRHGTPYAGDFFPLLN